MTDSLTTVQYHLIIMSFINFYDIYAISTKMNLLKKKILEILFRRFQLNLKMVWQKHCPVA